MIVAVSTTVALGCPAAGRLTVTTPSSLIVIASPDVTAHVIVDSNKPVLGKSKVFVTFVSISSLSLSIDTFSASLYAYILASSKIIVTFSTTSFVNLNPCKNPLTLTFKPSYAFNVLKLANG